MNPMMMPQTVLEVALVVQTVLVMGPFVWMVALEVALVAAQTVLTTNLGPSFWVVAL